MAKQKQQVQTAEQAGLTFQDVEKIWDQVDKIEEARKQMNISDQEIENTYALAYLMHQQKKYEMAAETFKLLMLLNLKDWRFPFGLAACLYGQGQWAEASVFFTTAGELNDDPLPFYYVGDCFHKLGNPEGAKMAYQEVLNRIESQKDKGRFQALQGQVQLLLQHLQRAK
jgi:type III secretion system low calcium response chaperone LcrH/SycD